MFFPTLLLYQLLLYRKYDRELMESNLVKSLRFNKSLEEITMEYYPKNIPISVKNNINAKDCLLEHKIFKNKEFFIIKTVDNSFLLPVDPIKSQIDSVLLKEIFRTKRDPLFYSAVIAKNKGFILDCPYTSNPNASVDNLIRESILSENEPEFYGKLNPLEVKERILNISDKEVEEYKNTISNQNDKKQGLDEVESTLTNLGIFKSKEACIFLKETFYVESMNHLIHLGDYELNCLANHIGLSSNEVDNLRISFQNLIKNK